RARRAGPARGASSPAGRGRRVRRAHGAPMSVRIGDSIRRRHGQRTQPPKRRGFPWARWLAYFALAAAVAFGAGYAVSVHVLFPAPEQATGGIPVPALAGRDVRDAERELLELGLELGDV